jgi:hypothetical protein
VGNRAESRVSDQHFQIGATTYSVNEHGVRIEHTAWRPSRLDEHGRCCGRKPLEYKTGGRHFICIRCDREYKPTGAQRPNWVYALDDMYVYTRNKLIPA